ncbi:MAG: hypothetical protein U0M66_04605 [Bacilli bacterium]|nr:hypothetical protein [Bacilli bacterium]
MFILLLFILILLMLIACILYDFTKFIMIKRNPKFINFLSKIDKDFWEESDFL